MILMPHCSYFVDWSVNAMTVLGANHDGVGSMGCKNKDGVGSDKDGVGSDISDFFSITSTRNMIIKLSKNFTYNVANSI